MPSGLLWRNCNIGANKIEESGLFFSWANTQGHEENSGYDFSQATYAGTPGASITTDLPLSADMANAYLGGSSRTPTAADFQELADNCTSIYTTYNGVSGRLFKSNINGRTIFMPSAGIFEGTEHRQYGSLGRYWSATYRGVNNADNFLFTRSDVTPVDNELRYRGFVVRAVMDQNI